MSDRSPPRSTPPSPRDGVVANRYRLAQEVAAGGNATVYRAENIWTGELVALKVPHLGMEPSLALRCFEREAAILRSTRHPNIVRLIDLGRTQPFGAYMAQELLQGVTLADLMPSQLSVMQAWTLLVPIMDALSHVHANGLVHCDVKPENILVTADEPPRSVLIDFGLCRSWGVSQLEGVVEGTPAYMAPEQLTGGYVDARADIWALCACFYELTTGALPFPEGSPGDVLVPRPPSSLTSQMPVGVDAALLRGLSRNPDDRWQTVDDLKLALRFATMPPRTARGREATLAPPPLRTPDLPSDIIRMGVITTSADVDEQALEDALRDPESGWASRVVSYWSYRKLASALATAEIDMAWMSPIALGYARSQSDVRPIATVVRGGQAGYRVVLLGRGVDTLDDLVGKRAVWVDSLSAAGYLVPRALIRAHGLEPDEALAAQGFVGSYGAALEALRRGTAELTSGFLYLDEAGRPHDLWSPGEFSVLAMSEPVPGDVICVRSGLPDATIAGLELSLTEGDRGRGVAQSLGGEELTAPDIRAYERFYASVEDDIFHEPR